MADHTHPHDIDPARTPPPSLRPAQPISTPISHMLQHRSLSPPGRLMDGMDGCQLDEQEVEIMEQELLGEGHFGRVYKANLRSCLVVAKRLKSSGSLDSPLLQQFLKEARVWAQLRHPHLVQFLGFTLPRISAEQPSSSSPPPSPCLVSEYMPHGSLYAYIHVRKQKLSLVEMLRLSSHIAKGLYYLHSRSLIHRDLSSSNILLHYSPQLSAKV